MNMDCAICEVQPTVLHITDTEVGTQEVILVQMSPCKLTCPKQRVGTITSVELRHENTDIIFVTLHQACCIFITNSCTVL